MTICKPNRTRLGTLVQGAVPTGLPGGLRANGLSLRGVVVAVYVYDTPDVLPNIPDVQANNVYVDVLLYGLRFNVLPRVLWTKARSGLHEGDVSLPRAATIDTSGEDFDVLKSDPQALDGDHVVVGFLEDDLTQPYVVASLNHPSSDIGNSGRPLGQRMRLTEADGNPRFWKHRGAAFGLDKDGNWLLDTRRAHGGEYLADGSEPDPTEDGSNGNVILDLPRGSTVTIRINDGAQLTLEDQDGEATLTLGDGAVSVAVADHLQTLYEQLKAQFDAHQHLYAFGPTGPAQTAGFTAPDWDPNINSDKATIPDT